MNEWRCGPECPFWRELEATPNVPGVVYCTKWDHITEKNCDCNWTLAEMAADVATTLAVVAMRIAKVGRA